jgi:hypothetical protein
VGTWLTVPEDPWGGDTGTATFEERLKGLRELQAQLQSKKCPQPWGPFP